MVLIWRGNMVDSKDEGGMDREEKVWTWSLGEYLFHDRLEVLKF